MGDFRLLEALQNWTSPVGLLGLGLEAKFSGLGLEAFGLGLVFLALALASFKARPRSK